ncbi:MAG: hypothetical protein ACREEV_13560 [Dongiaceae bacterium]
MGFAGHVRQHPGDALNCQGAAVDESTEERTESIHCSWGRPMKKAIIIALFMGLSVSVWWYLWVLLRRTGFLAHGISIANDSIHIMYLACGALVLTAGYAAFRRVVWPALGYSMLLIAAAPAAAFTWLNQSETVCMSKKDGQCISLTRLRTGQPRI